LSVGGWGGWNYAVGSSMLLASAIGQEIRSYCIFDSDYHTPNQIEKRRMEAGEKGLSLHVWRYKELENYLLVPDAILRSLHVGARNVDIELSVEVLSNKLFELAGEFENEIMDGFASEFLAEN
jgi:hypothetical protein